MLAFLMGLFDPIKAITTAILNWEAQKANAQTEQERIRANEEIEQLKARRDVLVAEAMDPINRIIRFMMAGPFIVYVTKLVLWDKVITGGHGNTDPLDPNLWYLCMLVYGFYFLDAGVRRVVRSLKS